MSGVLLCVSLTRCSHSYVRWLQARCGITTVVVLCGTCICLMHANAGRPARYWWLGVLAVYLEAALAFVSLAVILYKEPGTVQRSTGTCYPQPEAVADSQQDQTHTAQ